MSKILTRGKPAYFWISSVVDGIIEIRLNRSSSEYERYILIRKLRLHLAEPKCYKYDIVKEIIGYDEPSYGKRQASVFHPYLFSGAIL